MPNVVAASVVLHNMCELFGDHFREEWANHDDSQTPTIQASPSNQGSSDGSNIRNAIMEHLTSTSE